MSDPQAHHGFTFSNPQTLHGQRIDRVVAHGAGVSRRVARTLVATGKVRLGNKTVRILSRTVPAGTKVSVEQPVSTDQSELDTAGAAHLEILYADSEIVLVNKPSGLLSEPDRYGSPSILQLLPQALAQKGESRTDLWLVHRLDAGTSGVMVLARRPQASRRLGDAFRHGTVRKRYLALVLGELAKPLSINQPIGRERGSKHGVMPGGKPALTSVRPLAANGLASLVRCMPQTGRTHQIRVHLASVGHPLLGDKLYGGPRYLGQVMKTDEDAPVARFMLHAQSLAFPHPRNGSVVTFEAPVPQDFEMLARRLEIWPEGEV